MFCWPSCHLVHGKPRHSGSNGGVERSSRTIEDKLGLWMNKNKSKHWSVSLPLVQWEMNTQTQKGIGGKIPDHLFTGQNPRVGILNVPIKPKLIKKLSTEAQLSALLDLDPNIPLEDAVVKSYQTARFSGEVQELAAQPAMVTLSLNPPVAAVQESTAQPCVAIQPPMESSIRIFNPPVAKSPDVFCQPVHQKMQARSLPRHLATRHGVYQQTVVAEELLEQRASAAYRTEQHPDGKPTCPVGGCLGVTKDGWNMRQHFQDMHLWDTVTVPKEGRSYPWCRHCRMQVNLWFTGHWKTKSCVIGTERKAQHKAAIDLAITLGCNFKVHGEVLEKVEVFKYLGRLLAQDNDDIQAVRLHI